MLPVTPSGDGVKIGAQVRKFRKERRLTLDQLAEATGLSKGFISRIERDATSPSITSLAAICDVLSIRVGELFDRPKTEIVHLIDAPVISLGGEGIREWLITPRGERSVQMLRSEIEPGASSEEGFYSIDCDTEVVHVMEGTLTISVPGSTHELIAGDTVTFPGREPHSWHNPGQGMAVVLFTLIFERSR